ncbi:hypothetical protein [Leptospira biflexa]|uniref:hypothetical protein n=1 Tax=Leptospira biflexa TaxID=172 RepID=UPI00109148B2|nr:hypothetical protein [Leptospira biflexa]TGM30982.1 hypothetical protein EHQ89_17245 [Leptospira biflexa]
MFKNNKKSGYDDIDIIIEFEQTFNVQFTDEDASKIFLVGDLFDLLTKKISHVQSSNSFQLISFYDFRKKLKSYNISIRINDLNNPPFSKEFFFKNKHLLLKNFPF